MGSIAETLQGLLETQVTRADFVKQGPKKLAVGTLAASKMIETLLAPDSTETPPPAALLTKKDYLQQAVELLQNPEFLRQQGFYQYTNTSGEKIIFATGQDDLQPEELAQIAEKLAKEETERLASFYPEQFANLESSPLAPRKGEKLRQVEDLPPEAQMAILAALNRARDSGISASLASLRVFSFPVHIGGEIKYHTTTGIGPPNPQALADDFYLYSPLSPWTQVASHYDSYRDKTGAIRVRFMRDNYTEPTGPDLSFNRIRREAPPAQDGNGEESFLYLDTWTQIEDDSHVTTEDGKKLPYLTRLSAYKMSVDPKTGSTSRPVGIRFAYHPVEGDYYGRIDYGRVVNDFGPTTPSDFDILQQPPTPVL